MKQSDKDLRKKAEKELGPYLESDIRELLPDEAAHLIHELRVHQVELEMQNDELRSAQAELEKSRARYSDLYDFAPVGYFTFDKKGTILELNLTGATLLGAERGVLIKKPFSLFVLKDDQDIYYHHRHGVLEQKMPQRCEIRLKSKQGTVFYAQLESVAVEEGEGGPGQCRTVVTDISQRKRFIEELMESETRFRTLFEQAAVGVAQIISRTGKFVSINKRYCDIVGYSRDEIKKMTFQEITHPDDLQPDLDNMKLLIKGEITEFSMEKRYFHKNGSIVWVNLTVSPMWRPGETPYYHIAVVEDISARKKAEAALQESKHKLEIKVKERTAELSSAVERLNAEIVEHKKTETQLFKQKEFIDSILESVINPLYVIDANDFRVVHMNSAARFDNMPEDITCHALLHGLKRPCPEKKYKCTIKEIIKTKKPAMFEHVHFENGGGPRTVEVHGYPIFGNDGDVRQVIEYVLDITERKKAEEQLKASLKEKEVLLQEVHHRVKNNMTVISSLLKLQANSAQDERYREMLNVSIDRIKTMALIHEKLYQVKNLHEISFNDYIEDMIDRMFMSYRIDSDKVRLKKDIGKVVLGIDAAIPCGLIVNELISNALKYAFPESREGEIKVVLRSCDKDKVELTISDNGVGIPKGLDFKNSDSLGLSLVNALIKQLRGNIELDREKGTVFKITFGKSV